MYLSSAINIKSILIVFIFSFFFVLWSHNLVLHYPWSAVFQGTTNRRIIILSCFSVIMVRARKKTPDLLTFDLTNIDEIKKTLSSSPSTSSISNLVNARDVLTAFMRTVVNKDILISKFMAIAPQHNSNGDRITYDLSKMKPAKLRENIINISLSDITMKKGTYEEKPSSTDSITSNTKRKNKINAISPSPSKKKRNETILTPVAKSTKPPPSSKKAYASAKEHLAKSKNTEEKER